MARARGTLRPAWVAVVLVVGAVLALTSCTAGVGGAEERKVRDAIVASAPGVDAALVRFRVDAFAQEVDVSLSVPGVAPEDAAALAGAIDVALEQAWRVPSFEPSRVNVEAAVDVFEVGDAPGDSGGTTLQGLGIDAILNLDNDALRALLSVGADELAARYGPRGDS